MCRTNTLTDLQSDRISYVAVREGHTTEGDKKISARTVLVIKWKSLRSQKSN